MKKFYYNSKESLRNWLLKNIQEPILHRYGNIYLTSTQHKEMRENFCQGCAGPLRDRRWYFGQYFCGGCVAKWDPNNVYAKMKVIRGWKQDLRKLFGKK